MAAFSKIIYLSYRKDFEPLLEYNNTSDVGWGCMARTGQMMLARCLCITLGVFNQKKIAWMDDLSRERVVLSFFHDEVNDVEHPYSIHSIINAHLHLHGRDVQSEHKNGVWFSPTRITKVLK